MYGCIYIIENKINEKRYIGQTIQNPKKREWQHFGKLRKDEHDNPHLQFAFNKYGEESFIFYVILECDSQEELNKKEKFFIQKYDTRDPLFGYNMREGGANGKHSVETCEKIKKSVRGINKGEKNPMYGKKGILWPLYGKPRTQEHCRRISESNLGKRHTFESKRKISVGGWKKGKFGFTGASFRSNENSEKKCWISLIKYNGFQKSLGYYNDPLSAEIVYKIVWNEIYNK